MNQTRNSIQKKESLFKRLKRIKPLYAILLIALVIRVVAAIFSKGYVVYHEHFAVIETAQAWIDDVDYRNWNPLSEIENSKPIGQSLTYVGMHYYILKAFSYLGLDNVNLKMFFIRLFHALFSLLVVNYAYRITHLLSNKDMARYVGLLVATFWILPFASVHTLPEVFAIPFYLLSIWFLIRPQYREKPVKWALFSGFTLGVALSLWFLGFMLVIGIFLVLLIKKNWKALSFSILGFGFALSVFQGAIDYWVWGRPFAEITQFIHSLNIPMSMPDHTVFSMYVLLLLFMFVPPMSFLWLSGWIHSGRRYIVLFLPVLLAFLFFSLSSQQHERFVVVLLPFIIITGVLGWDRVLQRSVFWSNRPGLYKSFLLFFWVVNFMMVLPVSTMYSKKGQVESMLYLKENAVHLETILIEDSNRDKVHSMPQFYLNKWVNVIELSKYQEIEPDREVDTITNWRFQINHPALIRHSSIPMPEYVLFIGRERLDERVQKLMYYMPEIDYTRTIKPGLIDRLLYKVNPEYNINESIYIYKVANR